jgi:ankyrin repeat protein
MRELFDAIAAGDVARVRELVAADATLAGSRDEEGVSARMRAYHRGDPALIGLLVDSGPELDVFEAAAMGAEERLEELVAHDRTCVGARTPDGFTPLHLAAFFCHPGAVRLLLAAGADAGAVAHNEGRKRPLDVAEDAGCAEVVELLGPAQDTSSTP